MTSGKLGMCLVLEDKKLLGIITDGDLRRALNAEKFNALAKEIMTRNPKTIGQEAMASEAESLMLQYKIKELVVMDSFNVVGVVQLYAIAGV